jgi:tripartite-type tricarboxylate transporter receptor subunit TctC
MHANPGWDILKDFEPVSLVATIEWGLVAEQRVGHQERGRSHRGAKAKPGQVNFGSGGNGSPQHVAMALFASQAGISMTHVPYKGATQAALGVAAGDVPVRCRARDRRGPRRGGKLKLVGVATPAAERGFPGRAHDRLVGPSRLPVQLLVHGDGARRARRRKSSRA